VAVEYTDPVELPDDDYPFVMNTGRQLYTGTRHMTRAQRLDAASQRPSSKSIRGREAIERAGG